MEALVSTMRDLPDIIKKTEEMDKNAEGLKDSLKGEIDALDQMQKGKTIANIAVNKKTIADAIPKLKDLNKQVEEAFKDAEEEAKSCVSQVEKADETGAKVMLEDPQMNMKLIMQKFHLGPFKTAAELAQEEKNKPKKDSSSAPEKQSPTNN